MAMKKKAAAPEPAGESAPMWIVSFADLVTLLMSFFVVLYALKQGGAQQQLEVAAAIKAQFDPSYMPINSSDPFDLEVMRLRQGKSGPPLLNHGGNNPKPTDGTDGRDDRVENIRPGKQVVSGSKITFDRNDTKLDDASIKTISAIADKLRGLNNVLFVKGHVSADEISADDPGGMILSTKRAEKVIDELVRLGIERRVLRPLACGPYEPVKTGAYDQASLRLNRRVEIYSTDNTASDYTPISTVQATTDMAAHADEKKP